MRVSLHVNGRRVERDVDPRTLLVALLREHLGLVGTHVGCETSQCGACTVHVDGRAVKACTMLALEAEGGDVTTIEGVAPSPTELHPMQEAFRTHHGLQCGYCTPGMVMLGLDVARRHLERGELPDEATIRLELKGNVCRCTGYRNIVVAIREGTRAMAAGQGASGAAAAPGDASASAS